MATRKFMLTTFVNQSRPITVLVEANDATAAVAETKEHGAKWIDEGWRDLEDLENVCTKGWDEPLLAEALRDYGWRELSPADGWHVWERVQQ